MGWNLFLISGEADHRLHHALPRYTSCRDSGPCRLPTWSTQSRPPLTCLAAGFALPSRSFTRTLTVRHCRNIGTVVAPTASVPDLLMFPLFFACGLSALMFVPAGRFSSTCKRIVFVQVEETGLCTFAPVSGELSTPNQFAHSETVQLHHNHRFSHFFDVDVLCDVGGALMNLDALLYDTPSVHSAHVLVNKPVGTPSAHRRQLQKKPKRKSVRASTKRQHLARLRQLQRDREFDEWCASAPAVGAATPSGKACAFERGSQVFVRFLGKTVAIDVDLSSTSVEHLKQLLETKLGVPVGEQWLHFRGRRLHGHAPLCQLGIRRLDRMFLGLRQCGGAEFDDAAGAAAGEQQPSVRPASSGAVYGSASNDSDSERRFLLLYKVYFKVLEGVRPFVTAAVKKEHAEIKRHLSSVHPSFAQQCGCGNHDFSDISRKNAPKNMRTFRVDAAYVRGKGDRCLVKDCSGCALQPCKHLKRYFSRDAKATNGNAQPPPALPFCWCEVWASEIAKRHVNETCCWGNTDPMLWASSEWEWVKVLMGKICDFDVIGRRPGEHAREKKCADDHDGTCLFNMMRYSTMFKTGEFEVSLGNGPSESSIADPLLQLSCI